MSTYVRLFHIRNMKYLTSSKMLTLICGDKEPYNFDNLEMNHFKVRARQDKFSEFAYLTNVKTNKLKRKLIKIINKADK